MARQVLPIVGAVIGGIYGGPQGAQIGFTIGSIVGNAVDPQRLAGPKIGDVPVQTAEEGVVCPLIAGTAPAFGNLIYKHLFDPVPVEERQAKGGGPIIESERLYGTFAIRICASLMDGPGHRVGISAIRRIWEDEKPVYDVSEDSQIAEESAAYAEQFTFYPGNETQLPDPDLEAIEGVNNVPSYRGRAYVVFSYKDLTDRRGSVPQFRFEVSVTGSVTARGATIVTDTRHYSGEPQALTAGPANTWAIASAVGGSISMSPDGYYAAGGRATSPFLMLSKYDPDTDAWSALPNPADLPADTVTGTAFSPDGNYLAVRHSGAGGLIVYRRSGDTFTKIADPATMPGAVAGVCRWSVDGLKLAVTLAVTSAPSYGVYVYEFVPGPDLLVNAVGAEAVVTNSPVAIDWLQNPENRYLAVGTGSEVYVLDTEDSPMRIAATASGIGTGLGGAGVHFDATAGYLIAVSTAPIGGSYVRAYDFDYSVIGTESLTLLTPDPTDQPSNAEYSVMSPERDYLLIGQGTNAPYLYTVAGTPPVFTEAAVQPPNLATLATDVAWRQSAATDIVAAGTETLPNVVEAIFKRVKQPASLADTSQLSGDIVRGLVLGSQDYTAADALRSLAQVYLYDVADYDEQLHFIKRGGAVEFSITEDDIVEESDTDQFKRFNAIEQPAKISLFFQNATIYYQPSKVNPPFIGYQGLAVNEVTVQVPVVLNEADEAPQLVDKMQKITEADAQGEITRIVPDRFCYVVPGMVGAITERGITRRVRVVTVQEYDSRLKMTFRVDRQSAVTSELTVTPTPAPNPPPPSLAGVTQFAVMNLPGIIDSDDRIGVRMAVSGLPGTGWRGALIQVSSDGGASYSNLVTITRSCIMGTLTADLPEAPYAYTDSTNPLTVTLLDDRDLETITQAQFLSEQNGAAILKADNTAEVIQYRDATDNGSRSWTLQTLLRGRLNTAPATHLVGAKFVDLAGSVFVPLPSLYIGMALKFRVVSIGTSPETAPIYDFAFDPVVSQTEFGAEYLVLDRDSSTISGSWTPRHRFGTEINPIASSNFDGWRVEITDGSYTETFDTINANFSVSEAPYTGAVTVNVYQLNRITGEGPVLTGSI